MADKKAIFKAVINTRKNNLFKKDWTQIDSLYSELDEDRRAGEIIASVAENEPGVTKRFIDFIVNKIMEVLKKIGFINQGDCCQKLKSIKGYLLKGMLPFYFIRVIFYCEGRGKWRRNRTG